MKGPLNFQRKGLFWFGVSALLIWHGPLSVADNAPAPELAEDAGRLAEQAERYRVAGDTVALDATEKKLAGMKTDRPAALLALAWLLNAEGKNAEAEQALWQALADPEFFGSTCELRPVSYGLGQYEKAALIMEKALKQRPQDYFLTVALAKCYVRMGRLEQAKAAFAQAKRINDKGAEAYIAQGYTYMNMGEDDQSRREFKSLIDVDTANPLGYLHMGSYLYKQRHSHEGEEYLQQAVKMLEAKPSSYPGELAHALSNLGNALAQQGKSSEVEAVYRKGLEQTHPDLHFRSYFLNELGTLANAQGKFVEAEQLYKQAMAVCVPTEFGPRLGCVRQDWAGAAFNLAVLYAAQGRNPEATALAKRIGKSYDGRPIDEDTIDYVLGLGNLYAELGQSAKAEVIWRRILTARENMPTHMSMARAEVALAGLCERRGRLAEAENLYLKAIEVFRRHSDVDSGVRALYGLAAAYEKEGKSREAAAARRQAEALMAKGGKL